MAGEAEPGASLRLTVSPLVRRGEQITATVEATNVSETVVELSPPDTVVISRPHRQVAGMGTFARRIEWLVEHVQPGTTAMVEITASAGTITQVGLCRVTER